MLIETADAGRQGLVAGDSAVAAVIDRPGVEAQAVEAGQLAALVVHRPRGGDAQGLAGVHQPSHVIQRLHAQRRGGQRRQFAMTVVQVADGRAECAGTGDQTFRVHYLISNNVQSATAQHPALVLVVQGGDGEVGDLSSAQRAALVAQGLARVHRQAAAGDHAFAGVVEILRRQAHIAAGIATGVSVDSGFDDAVVGQNPTGRQRDAVPCGKGLLVGQVALGLHIQGRAGIDRSLGVEAGCFDIHRARSRSLRQAEMPTGVNLDITAAGGQVAGQFHPDPGFGPTSLIAPAYMPPNAELSMASCGLTLPSSARAVALRVCALTSLRPATIVRFFA